MMEYGEILLGFRDVKCAPANGEKANFRIAHYVFFCILSKQVGRKYIKDGNGGRMQSIE